MSTTQSSGPPYKPQIAGVGGEATPIPDVPISAILLVFYVVSAACNMTIFQINRRKKYKFIPSVALFGFSMARILTLALRISLSYYPNNVSLYIAETIFLNAGVLVVYVLDVLFVMRILRARQPELGWHPALRILTKAIYAIIALFLALVIIFINISYYTLDANLRTTSSNMIKAALTYFLIITALPLAILAITYILPVSPKAETFGTGSMVTKSLIVLTSTCLATLGAGFKAGVTWSPPRPLSNPAWYHDKPAFYIFYFVLEILILYFFLAMRIDQRFYVPNGSSKRRTYAIQQPGTAGGDLEAQPRQAQAQTQQATSSGRPSVDTTEKERPEV